MEPETQSPFRENANNNIDDLLKGTPVIVVARTEGKYGLITYEGTYKGLVVLGEKQLIGLIEGYYEKFGYTGTTRFKESYVDLERITSISVEE